MQMMEENKGINADGTLTLGDSLVGRVLNPIWGRANLQISFQPRLPWYTSGPNKVSLEENMEENKGINADGVDLGG